MKKLILTLSMIVAINLNAENLSATFADADTWDGKSVPTDAVCSDYNMEAGSSPEIVLDNVPQGTTKLILSFSDETFSGMRDGGHGVVSYIPPVYSKKLTIPSFEGETFDLPENFNSVIAHRAAKYGKPEGAYLAPCSGGKGNTYSVIIEAKNADDKQLSSTQLTLGKY
ncbi:hypothetical protein N9W00_01355 [Arcobacteraceae bacterium]|nr:hypothetical protein [Arcobacteraceae bacterium]